MAHHQTFLSGLTTVPFPSNLPPFWFRKERVRVHLLAPRVACPIATCMARSQNDTLIASRPTTRHRPARVPPWQAVLVHTRRYEFTSTYYEQPSFPGPGRWVRYPYQNDYMRILGLGEQCGNRSVLWRCVKYVGRNQGTDVIN